MGQVIDFETRIDRPCDTEPPCEGADMTDRILKSAQAVEGYKAKHTEPTSSNPFPFVRVVCDKFRIQAAHDFFEDLVLTADEFENLGVECMLAARRLRRREREGR